MNQWINYHHLFYFKTIAEEGTVSKAAEKLSLGQPTLSAQLKQFEDTIGVQLFERHHKKLVLTEQGKVALDYSKNIFRMGSEMYEVLHDRLKPLKPSLHLGALDSVPKQIVLQLVKHAFRISPCQISFMLFSWIFPISVTAAMSKPQTMTFPLESMFNLSKIKGHGILSSGVK